MYGKVRIQYMKFHIVLQALSSIQVQRKHLRIYVKIEELEQGKLEIWRLSDKDAVVFHIKGDEFFKLAHELNTKNTRPIQTTLFDF